MKKIIISLTILFSIQLFGAELVVQTKEEKVKMEKKAQETMLRIRQLVEFQKMQDQRIGIYSRNYSVGGISTPNIRVASPEKNKDLNNETKTEFNKDKFNDLTDMNSALNPEKQESTPDSNQVKENVEDISLPEENKEELSDNSNLTETPGESEKETTPDKQALEQQKYEVLEEAQRKREELDIYWKEYDKMMSSGNQQQAEDYYNSIIIPVQDQLVKLQEEELELNMKLSNVSFGDDVQVIQGEGPGEKNTEISVLENGMEGGAVSADERIKMIDEETSVLQSQLTELLESGKKEQADKLYNDFIKPLLDEKEQLLKNTQ